MQRSRDECALAITKYEREWLTAAQIDGLSAKAIDELTVIHDQLMSEDRTGIRRAMVQLVEKITLWFQTTPVRKRIKRPFERGVMRIRTRPVPTAEVPIVTFSKKGEIHFSAADLLPISRL